MDRRLAPGARIKSRRFAPLRSYLPASLAPVIVSALAGVAFGPARLVEVVMLYLLGVVVVALRLGRGPSLWAAVLSVLSIDFFFVPPYLSFAVSDFQHVITFGVMLLVAAVIGSLVETVRSQGESARDKERSTAVLYAMSRDLVRAQGVQAIAKVASLHVREVCNSGIAVLLVKQDEGLTPVYQSEGVAAALLAEQSSLRRAWLSQPDASVGAPVLSAGEGLYLPLVASRGPLGVVGFFPVGPTRVHPSEQRDILVAFATQMAAAIERATLADDAESRRVQIETEQLKNALLSSVSHDLRTPLAVISGAASTLLVGEESLPLEERRELLRSIYDEGERLNRLIRNLLDMTRLESGAIKVKKEWYPIEEIIGSALTRAEHRLQDRPIRISIPDDLMAPIDGVLIEQLLINLLENAAKYTPAGSPLDITASSVGHEVLLEIADSGPGILPGHEKLIFEKFARANHEGEPDGAGLGLAIAQGIAAAHGGRLWAENRPGGGASLKLTLPVDGVLPRLSAVLLGEEEYSHEG